MPLLRGLISSENRMIGHFSDAYKILEFINSNDLSRLAPTGTSCPDYFLRTIIKPLVLTLNTDDNLEDSKSDLLKLKPAIFSFSLIR